MKMAKNKFRFNGIAIILLIALCSFASAFNIINCSDPDVITSLFFNNTASPLTTGCGSNLVSWAENGEVTYRQESWEGNPDDYSVLTTEGGGSPYGYFQANQTLCGYMANTDFSMLLVLNMTTNQEDAGYNMFFSNNKDAEGKGIYYYGFNGVTRIWAGGGQGKGYLASTLPFDYKNYTFVAFTYNDSSERGRLYVNDTLALEGDFLVNNLDCNLALIGENAFSGSQTSENNIAGFILFNKMLDYDELHTYFGRFNNGTAAPAPPPSAIASKIDLLFRNTTDSIYKTQFGEGEDFYTYINWTNSTGSNSPLNSTHGVCNITALGAVLEELTKDQSFSLCDNVGCDYPYYNNTLTFHSTANAVKDFIRVEICHADNVNENLEVNINCTGHTHTEMIDKSGFPKCIDGTSILHINTSGCINYLNVNISIQNDGKTTDKRHTISLLELDREFSEHTNLNGTDVIYNQTLGLWQTNHTHEYYEHGLKEIYANCTHLTESGYNNQTSENILIVSTAPSIIFDEVNYTVGIKQLTNLVNIPYYSGIWEWIVIVMGLDIDIINYTFYNTAGSQLQSNKSASPITIETPDALFSDYNKFFNLTVTANNTAGNITISSIKFNATAPPNVTVIHPITNVTLNVDIIINFTTSVETNCSLNNTLWVIQELTNSSYYYLETTAPDEHYFIDIECNDSFGGSVTKLINFTKDTTIPAIVTTSPNEANTTLWFNTGSITLNSTFTDNIELFVYNITIDTVGAVRVYNSNGTLSGASYKFGAVIDTSNWDNTTYIESIRVCDKHTLNEIPDATAILKFNSSIRYQFGDVWVRIKSINGNEFSTNTEKLKDRYSFTFSYDQPSPLKIYEVTSNKGFKYFSKSKYKGHFIIDDFLWLDFENEKDAGVSVEKTDEGYLIYIDDSSKVVTFNSIGYLNCVTEDYRFRLSESELEVGVYNINLLAGNLFNTAILDTSTTAGVLLFFFLFFTFFMLVVFGEYSQIPAVMILTSIYGFFLGLLFYVSLSAIMGFIFVILSIFYMIRSITFTGKGL